MTAKEQLLQEIEQAPESLVQSCLELILSHKTAQNNKPIWQIADEIIATIPEESFDQIPIDAADNLDYYLYGNPSKK